MSAKVQYSKAKLCVLCSKNESVDASHNIYACPNFDSPVAKVERLKILVGCTKCGKVNHPLKSCRFKFKSRCLKCKSWDMTFLCSKASFDNKSPVTEQANSIFDNDREVGSSSDTKPDNYDGLDVKSLGTKPKPNSKSKITNNVATVTKIMRCTEEENSILRTFAVKIRNLAVRGLKDSGCQSNFISAELAKKLKLKVLKHDVRLSINGINNSKDYKTKLVEVPAEVKGQCFYTKSLCLPSINISLNLPGLQKVVLEFKSKGYKLVDCFLGDSNDKIDNINLIFVSKSDHIVLVQDVIFGEEHTSV